MITIIPRIFRSAIQQLVFKSATRIAISKVFKNIFFSKKGNEKIYLKVWGDSYKRHAIRQRIFSLSLLRTRPWRHPQGTLAVEMSLLEKDVCSKYKKCGRSNTDGTEIMFSWPPFIPLGQFFYTDESSGRYQRKPRGKTEGKEKKERTREEKEGKSDTSAAILRAGS